MYYSSQKLFVNQGPKAPRRIAFPMPNHALNNRLRARVQAIVHESGLLKKTDWVVPGLEKLTEKQHGSHAIYVQILWFLILLGCFSTCCYQITERIMYFYSYPTVANIMFPVIKNYELPSVTTCNTRTDALKDFIDKNEKKMEASSALYYYHILRTSIKLFSENNTVVSMPIDELWTKSNPNPLLVDAFLHKRDKMIGPVSITTVPIFYATCLTINAMTPVKYMRSYSGIRLKFRLIRMNTEEVHPQAVIIHEPFEYPTAFTLYVTPTGSLENYALTLTKTSLLNTPLKKCVDDKTNSECFRLCLLRKYHESSFTCRFPFYPPEINLPDCTIDRKTVYDEYMKAMIMNMQTHPQSNYCNCPRKCVQRSFTIAYLDPVKEDTTTLYFFMNEDYFTFVDETYAYTFISLICDIGGNVGLYSGLSILSMFSLVQTTVDLVRGRFSRDNARMKARNRLNQKIERLIAEEITKKSSRDASKVPGSNLMKNVSLASINGIFRLFSFILLLIGMLYFIYNRVTFYFTYPTIVTINVLHNTTMYFPPMYLCGPSQDLLGQMQEAALERNLTNRVCVPDMLDLIGPNTFVDPETLWAEESGVGADESTDINPGKQLWDYEVIEGKMTRDLYLSPFGTCTKYVVEPQLYSGTTTTVTMLLLSEDVCYNSEIWFFVGSFDDKMIEYSVGQLFRLGTFIISQMQVTEFYFPDTPTNPCSNSAYVECREKCLKDKLAKKIKCRLPFIDDKRLLMCKTPESAKHTRAEFLKLQLSEDVVAECKCTPRCYIASFEFKTKPAVADQELTSIGILYQSNVIRQVNRVVAYKLIKLICDLGGILGLMLGLSVLGMLELGQNIVAAIV